MTRWRRGAASTIASYHVFGVQRLELLRDDGTTRPVFTFTAPDWCNVVPLTEDGRVVLVRQHRWGSDAPSLEIPGGVVDPGEAPLDTARRELHEETGYDARELVSLGSVHPNPALQGNRLHMFLARGCRPSGRGQQLDELEDCEVVLFDRAALDDACAHGEIGHALVWAALHAWAMHERRERAAR